jgi:hypothetical protein
MNEGSHKVLVIILIFLSLFLLSSNLFCQDLERIGLWTKGFNTGPTYTIALNDNKIVFDSGRSIRLYDLDRMRELSAASPAVSLKLFYNYDLVLDFMAWEPLINIYEVKLDSSLILVKRIRFEDENRFIQVEQKDDKFLILFENKLKTIKILPDYEIELISEIEIQANQYSRFTTNENFCLLSFENELSIFDIASTDTPILISKYTTEGLNAIRDLEIKDKHIYYSGYKIGLKIINIANPRIPIEVGNYYFEQSSSLELYQDFVFLYDMGVNSVKILNVADVNQIVLENEINTGFDIIHIVKNKLFLSDYLYSGIKIFDISNPLNPNLESEISASNTRYAFNQIKIYKDVAYINSGSNGILITNPEDYSYFTKNNQIFQSVSKIEIDSTYLLASSDSLIYIYSLEDPANPQYISKFNTSAKYFNFFIENNYIYLFSRNTLTIYDYIHSIKNPEVLFNYNFFLPVTDGLEKCRKINSKIIIKTRWNDIYIFNSPNPTNTELDTVFDQWPYPDFFTFKNTVYACSDNQLNIYDISNPSNPIVLNSFDVSRDFYSIKFNNNIGFAVTTNPFPNDYQVSIMTIDFSNPDMPVELNLFDLEFGCYSLDFYKDNIYSCWGANGLAIYKMHNIVEVKSEINTVSNVFSLSNNYPNPFNPNTIIKYSVPFSNVILNPSIESGAKSPNSEIPNHTSTSSVTVRDDNMRVAIKVYDVLGKEIVTLVNENLQPGNYDVEFNATNLPSGVYFYRLQTDNFIETKKMVLLR